MSHNLKGVIYPVLFLGAVLFGNLIGKYEARPVVVYTRDVNNDGTRDVVVKDRIGPNFIFLQQEDGSFKRFKDYQREQLGTLSQDQTEERKTVESQLAEIVKNAEDK